MSGDWWFSLTAYTNANLRLLSLTRPHGIGEAVLAGIAITQVSVIRETDPFAEVVEGNTTSLRSVPHGRTRILWKEPGTGVKWSVVRISELLRD